MGRAEFILFSLTPVVVYYLNFQTIGQNFSQLFNHAVDVFDFYLFFKLALRLNRSIFWMI